MTSVIIRHVLLKEIIDYFVKVHGVESHGKRKIWLLASMVGWQPLVMLWLTYSLIPSYTPLTDGDI